MLKKRLLWQLYPLFMAIILGVLVLFTLISARTMRRFHLSEKENELRRVSVDVEARIRDALARGDFARVDELCKTIGARFDIRITVILAEGLVLGDTDSDPQLMDDHGRRPEVVQAMAGEVGRAERYSKTVGTEMLYVATPLFAPVDPAPRSPAPPMAIIRLAVPLSLINSALREMYAHLLLGLLVVTILTVLVSYGLARRLTWFLEQLRDCAQHYASGDLKRQPIVSGFIEMDQLAEAMHQMASQLDDRIETILTQKNELQAVLSSMVEGVIAVDTRRRLIGINQAAAKLIKADPNQMRGREINEVIRNSQLKAFIAKTLQEGGPVEGQILLRQVDDQETYLQARGVGLRDSENRCIGAVVVLDDQTRLRRIERIRSDFVANVSHELKTPITSIKGFVEMLQTNEVEDPADRSRFLDIIGRQVNRLIAIIEDLLSLSRIEQESGTQAIELRPCKLLTLLQSAVQSCQPKAASKSIGFEIECSEELSAQVNAALVEQAVVNLIDNAIKYSPLESLVKLQARQEDAELVISVIDNGCGISKDHLDRIFERFYRVDKARSRSLGGTGLGLAIVKHIAQAHNGYASVSSTPGKGSVFSIHIASTTASAL